MEHFCLQNVVNKNQHSYRSGKTGKSEGSFVVRKRSGKNIFLKVRDKSGKMILNHAACRYL